MALSVRRKRRAIPRDAANRRYHFHRFWNLELKRTIARINGRVLFVLDGIVARRVLRLRNDSNG